MREEDMAGEGAAAEPEPGTLAALLTAALSAKLGLQALLAENLR